VSIYSEPATLFERLACSTNTHNIVRAPSVQYQHTQQMNIKSDTVYLQTLYSICQLDCHVEAYRQYLLELATHFT